MPRKKNGVKNKPRQSDRVGATPGLVDLHFHGAFGIDVMTATADQLDELSRGLARAGIAGFCPTTLSAPPRELEAAVTRLGRWISSGSAPGARPLGIHLEGPFLHPDACGAHPPASLRALDLKELERLWAVSDGTLRILTLAPERLTGDNDLAAVCAWAARRSVRLSLGHSHATEAQARQAFASGFTGVTHAWNALPFHHRSPGPLGAALGRPGVHVELIIDRVHVSPEVIRWTLDLHAEGVCFVSDCAPAAATTDGRWCSFGPLRTRFHEGACRLENGALAGGGLLLTEALRGWLSHEKPDSLREARKLLKALLPCATTFPLRALGLKQRDTGLPKIRIVWSWGQDWKCEVQDSRVD